MEADDYAALLVWRQEDLRESLSRAAIGGKLLAEERAAENDSTASRRSSLLRAALLKSDSEKEPRY